MSSENNKNILETIDWTGHEDIKQELKQFMKLPKEERDKLTRKTIESLARSINVIASEKNKLVKLRLIKKLSQELERNRAKIIVRLVYMIKPEFRDLAVELAKALTKL